jgi:nucleotide-binding universal stress UspA family protein
VYDRIVVGTDGSPTAATAVHHALRLAAVTGAELHLVTAWSRVPAVALAHASLGTAGAPLLDDGAWVGPLHDRFADEAERRGVRLARHAAEGQPVQVLLDVVREVGADLLVTGNRGLSGVRGLLGSVPRSLATHAPCAVLVVPTTTS